MREVTVAPAIEVKPEETLFDLFLERARLHPEHVALAKAIDAGYREVTAQQFVDECISVAKGLLAHGVRPGDRVGLMSHTRYEWTLLDYALWAIGAVVVPIYETSSAPQIGWILGDSGAIGCIVESAETEAVVQRQRAGLPELRHLWRLDDTPTKSGASAEAGAVAILKATGVNVSEEEVHAARSSIGADDLATIIYTSGTTGRPKGCRLVHRNFLAGVRNAMTVLENEFNDQAKLLLFLPLAHVLAREIQCGALATETQLSFTADTTQLLADLAAFRPTVILAVPRLFEKVFNSARQKAVLNKQAAIFDRAVRTAIVYSSALDEKKPSWTLRAKHAAFDALVYRKIRTAVGGQCRAAISGGAPLGKRLGHFFRGVGLTVYEGYGLTETTAACTVNTPAALKIGTVGRPLPGVSIRIAEDGEVLVKGGIICDGYWNNPTATAQSFDAEGWFYTGDLGALDDDGFLTITGRKKEIIVTAGGKNVVPSILEDRLRAHPLVSQCLVLGDQRPFISCLITIDTEMFASWKAQHGKPSAATVPELRDDPVLLAELQVGIDEANRVVSRAESIRVFRVLSTDFTVETGELTPSLKVKRDVVLHNHAEEITAMYA